jgi:hypothetical protein
MKVIIAGMRDFFDYEVVKKVIKESGYPITEVVCGCAAGVDSLGERWAKENNIPISRFPADWNKHGRAAGPIRNQEMAVEGDKLIVVWDGESRGTGDMVRRMKKMNKDVYIKYV